MLHKFEKIVSEKRKFLCINGNMQHIHGAAFYRYALKQDERKKIAFLQPNEKCSLLFTHYKTIYDSIN